MTLPETFRFSQRSLQDYADCARRFQLRYVLMQPWPALITDSPQAFEEQMARGADFHRLAHQQALGIEPERLAETIHDANLAQWWQTFLAQPPADLPETVQRAEVVLTAPAPAQGGPGTGTGAKGKTELGVESVDHGLGANRAGGQAAGYRLVAKFDLLAAEPGERLVVVDWKTVLKQPQRPDLARRPQTTVYRYLAVEAGAAYFGGSRPAPEQVEMIYWFANHGGAVAQFPYDTAQHVAARKELAGLVAEIGARQEAIWPLTTDERHCRFCNYRSLCERGVRAGFLEDLDEDLEPGEIEIDLEQIAEVEF
jgi:hypothetical protein